LNGRYVHRLERTERKGREMRTGKEDEERREMKIGGKKEGQGRDEKEEKRTRKRKRREG
jgi:hypothetical protein